MSKQAVLKQIESEIVWTREKLEQDVKEWYGKENEWKFSHMIDNLSTEEAFIFDHAHTLALEWVYHLLDKESV